QLQESNVFNRLETIFLEHMSRHKVGKRAKAGHADSFSLERGDARDRRGSEERCLSLIILATDHGEIGAREIGVDDGAGRRVHDVDVPTQQSQHRLGTRTDVKKIEVGTILLVQSCFLTDPYDRESSGEGRVRHSQLLWMLPSDAK